MAKFELPIYDIQTGEVCKTVKRNFMPVDLYIRFQAFAEKLEGEKVKSDKEMFNSLKGLFLETFPEMTAEDYQKQTDIADVLFMMQEILEKSASIKSGDSKNG